MLCVVDFVLRLPLFMLFSHFFSSSRTLVSPSFLMFCALEANQTQLDSIGETVAIGKVIAISKDIVDFEEAALRVRQKFLDAKVYDFQWSDAMLSDEGTLKECMNSLTDKQIIKCIESIKVERLPAGLGGVDFPRRKISLCFKSPSPFTNTVGEVSIQINCATGETVVLQPLQWKSGSNTARKTSIFRLFDPGCENKKELFDAFTIFYQDPAIGHPDTGVEAVCTDAKSSVSFERDMILLREAIKEADEE